MHAEFVKLNTMSVNRESVENKQLLHWVVVDGAFKLQRKNSDYLCWQIVWTLSPSIKDHSTIDYPLGYIGVVSGK
jgi:hypothetical protein